MSRANSHPTPWPVAALFALIPLTGACDGSEENPEPEQIQIDPEEMKSAKARIDAFLEAWAPVSPIATSDVGDAAKAEQDRLRIELRTAGLAVGRAAHAAYLAGGDHLPLARVDLLDIYAHNAPTESEDFLAERLVTYVSGEALIQTEAARILAQTSPERAREVLEPLILATKHNRSLPDPERLLHAWILASKELGTLEPGLLVEVATGILRPAPVRTLAVRTLGEIQGIESQRALETVLVESGTDGYIRRRAAQALVQQLGPDARPILEEVADKETDPAFLTLLANILRDLDS